MRRPDELPPTAAESRDGFESTAWSLVLAAAQDVDDGAVVNRLCRKYWRPIYVFARRSGLAPADAEDVTQEFFAYFLAREWLKQADPARGSFRAFLLTLFRNFHANYRRRQAAEKRGGGVVAEPLFDATAAEQGFSAMASLEADPAQAYERTWASCLLDTALERLALEQQQVGHAARFEVLRPFVAQPPQPGDYERLSEALGLPRGRIAVLVHRHSRRFAELIRIEIADTLADRQGVEEELRVLLAAISR
ncbi:MAG TPA: sigma-70 family RNA polymerase sigma factor [Candidatus Didemnitutus sp.]|nr:sigma-70 family RNA polymerase sigma factor [Candidatus Didemnitutus sp.]